MGNGGLRVLSVVVALGVAAAIYWTMDPRTASRNPNFDRNYRILDAKGVPRARIFLFGSINLLSGSDLGQSLASKGFEVVYLGVPVIDPKVFRKDGLEYRQAQAKGLNDVVEEIAANRGSLRLAIGGGSIGGLNAMMAFSIVKKFVAWFAVFPVTKLSVLKEFQGVGNPKYFDPFNQLGELKNSIGFISQGTADDRVDFRLTQELHRAIASPLIEFIEYPGMPHESADILVIDLVRWLDRTL